MQLVVYAAIILHASCSKTVLGYCSYFMSVYMYAYEVQCEDEFVNCFYPTVNKFLKRDNKDLLYCTRPSTITPVLSNLPHSEWSRMMGIFSLQLRNVVKHN